MVKLHRFEISIAEVVILALQKQTWFKEEDKPWKKTA